MRKIYQKDKFEHQVKAMITSEDQMIYHFRNEKFSFASLN